VNLPGFHAEASLYRGGVYRRHGRADFPAGNSVVPSIPLCSNCDFILANCVKHGGLPRAVCTACALGVCDHGGEVPPVPLGGWHAWW
jgi:hypothetical protein